MFGMGLGEMLVILVLLLVVVGPDKLPGAARAIGKGIRDVRRHGHDLQETLESDENLGGAVRELRSALHGDVRSLKAVVRTPLSPPAATPGELPAVAAAPPPVADDGMPRLVPA